MTRFGWWKGLELLLRAVIGGSFIYAGWAKIGDPVGFADSVASFAILPNIVISAFALALPVFEIIAGALMLVGWPRGIGALAILCLSSIFVIALAQAIVRGLDVNCGCFGPAASTTNPWIDLVRNLLTFVGCGIVYRAQINSRITTDHYQSSLKPIRTAHQ